MPVVLVLVLSLVSIQTPSVGQANTANTLRLPEGAPRPAAKVEDFSWLAGAWAGDGLGGQVDEVWSAPSGGTMVGHFRLIRGGKPVFYEIMTLLPVEQSIEMRLKHVNPDMTGWEEKANFVTFRLVKQDETGAYFSGLTFKRISADHIEGYIALRQSGEVREERFTLRRVK